MIFYSLIINLFGFFWSKSFPTFLEIIDLHGFLILLAVNCCLGMIFIAFMNETRGKSIDVIDTTETKTSPERF